MYLVTAVILSIVLSNWINDNSFLSVISTEIQKYITCASYNFWIVYQYSRTWIIRINKRVRYLLRKLNKIFIHYLRNFGKRKCQISTELNIIKIIFEYN